MRRYVIKSGTIENMPFTKRENEHANMHILFPIGSAIMAIVVSFFSSSLALSLFTIAILFNLSGKGIQYTFFIINLFRKEEKILEEITTV